MVFCLSWILRIPLRTITHSDDDVLTSNRKLVFSTYLLISPLFLIYSVMFLNMGTSVGWTPGITSTFIIFTCVCPIHSITPWLYIRISKSNVSETFLNTWLLVLNTYVNVCANMWKSYDLFGAYCICAFINIVCYPTRFRLHMAYIVVGVLQYLYLQEMVDMEGSPSIRIVSEPVVSPRTGGIAGLLGSFLWWSFVAIGTMGILKDLRHAVQKANNSATLCQEVAEKIVAYDIHGAKDLLDGAAASNTHDVDFKLRLALISLVSNLELFRPHLPEYVWDIVQKRVGGGVPRRASHDDIRVAIVNEVVASLDSVSSSRDSNYSSSKGNSSNHITKEEDTGDATHVLVDGVSPSNANHPPCVPPPEESLLQFLGPEAVKHASVALIDFRRKVTPQDLKDIGDAEELCFTRPAAVRKLVNWAHSQAIETRGTLHSFVGDTIQATWCFQGPSEKPASFLTKMYCVFNTDKASGVYVSGAVATGGAINFMAGDKRQAYILHTAWRDVTRTLHDISRSTTAALICENTFRNSRHAITSRWVDVVSISGSTVANNNSSSNSLRGGGGGGSLLPSPFNTQIINVYEIVQERLQDVGGESGASAFTPQDDVSKAVQLCLSGQYVEAMALLREGVRPTATVERLVKKIKIAMQTSVRGDAFCSVSV